MLSTFYSSLADLTEQEHEIPEKLVWSYLVDLLMVSNCSLV